MTYIPFGTASEGPWSVLITPERAGWTYCGLRIADLTGEPIEFETGDEEMLVVPLAGSCEVVADGERIELAGRSSVFASVTDFAYLPIQASVRITGQGRIALPSAKATRRLPVRYGPAADVPVEIRGAGHATRQVNNFCAPEAFECDKLMAVEVLTPGGNWSSYPPHKHDTPGGQEAVLEEIYYFEGGEAVATSGSTARTSRSVLAEVSRATWCWCRTATTARRWPPPGTTCTTSTCSPGPGRSGPWPSATTPARLDPVDLGGPGRSIPGCRSARTPPDAAGAALRE